MDGQALQGKHKLKAYMEGKIKFRQSKSKKKKLSNLLFFKKFGLKLQWK